MKKVLVFLSLSILISLTALAQTRTVTGTVTANDDGSTLPGVTILIKGTSQGTTTNIGGNYSLPGVTETSVIVFTQQLGY